MAPLVLLIYATSYGAVFLAACFSTGSIPTSSLKSSQFHILYHHLVVLLLTYISLKAARSTGYKEMASGFGSCCDYKDAGSTVDSNSGE